MLYRPQRKKAQDQSSLTTQTDFEINKNNNN